MRKRELTRALLFSLPVAASRGEVKLNLCGKTKPSSYLPDLHRREPLGFSVKE